MHVRTSYRDAARVWENGGSAKHSTAGVESIAWAVQVATYHMGATERVCNYSAAHSLPLRFARHRRAFSMLCARVRWWRVLNGGPDMVAVEQTKTYG